MTKLVALCGFALMTIVPVANAASLNHTPASCIPESGNAKIIASGEGIASARVYFKSNAGNSEYYVEMLQGQDGFWAVLPVPAAETTAVSYRVVARDANGSETTVDTIKAPVSGECAGFTLGENEQKIASNLVVGQTTQVASLVGFRCDGVTNTITTAGEMRPYTECDDAAVAAIVPAVATSIATKAAVVGVGAAVGAISVVAIDNQDDDREPVSPVLPKK